MFLKNVLTNTNKTVEFNLVKSVEIVFKIKQDKLLKKNK